MSASRLPHRQRAGEGLLKARKNIRQEPALSFLYLHQHLIECYIHWAAAKISRRKAVCFLSGITNKNGCFCSKATSIQYLENVKHCNVNFI